MADQAASPGRHRRWLAALALLLLVALSAVPVLDQDAAGIHDEALKRALVTFALARTLNGVISVVQGTELALQPAGVGVTLTPGEILDPVNDLIERFSWVMLVASTSLGVQHFMLDVSAWWGVRLVTVVLGLALLASWLWPGERHAPWRRMLTSSLLLVLFIRLAAPLMVIANQAIYDTFLADNYNQASLQIEGATDELDAIREAQEPEQETGFLGTVNRSLDRLRLQQRLEQFRERSAELIAHLVDLLAVFILQTVILPLLFLWVFWGLARSIGRAASRGFGGDSRH